MRNKTVMVSGGFDPVHVGHVRMIREASEWGDVIVAINSDDWLIRKKGYVFMPWEERAEIIGNIKGVDGVIDNRTFRIFSEPTPPNPTARQLTMKLKLLSSVIDCLERSLLKM